MNDVTPKVAAHSTLYGASHTSNFKMCLRNVSPGRHPLQEGVHVNLTKNFLMFKEGLEGKKVLEHHPVLYVYQFLTFLIFKFYFLNNIKSSKFPISINFTYPLRKPIYPQIYPKITKKFAQKSKTWICDTRI